ncbi:MAG: Gfo/Idh/MocA family oxidoreductase [Spirochaetaceae bacterium]|nr:Gfo/Idh/MocA family oxidoreductase [Spirochaetaceae bacterium]MDE0447525.1 Gfo/Idh/MocA family oxidoreductase [Spirochaetaceae bacterium]
MAIRIGILGCGRMSRNHAKRILEHPDAELVALCDVDTGLIERWVEENLLEPLAGSPAPPAYADAAAMYREAALDAVVISTPHTAHFEHGKQAIAAGCHVFMEKPMVTDTAQARELERLVAASGRILVVGYNTPSTPAFRYLREVVRAGTLGKLELVDGFLSQGWRASTTGTWRQDPALSGGGQAYDSGSHLLNSVVWTVESSPERVFAFMDNQGTPVDINSVLAVRFANGVMASITVSGNCAAAGAGLVFIFENGRVEIDGWTGSWIRVYGADGEIEPELPGGAAAPIVSFIDAVLGRAEPASSPRNGVIYSELMDAVYASAASGAPASPPR